LKNQPFIPLTPALSRPGRGGFQEVFDLLTFKKRAVGSNPLMNGISHWPTAYARQRGVRRPVQYTHAEKSGDFAPLPKKVSEGKTGKEKK
jgi:hypothetical protein